MAIALRFIALAAAGCGCLGAVVAGGACIVVPPPDLAVVPPRRPTILRTSVTPSADLLLTKLPAQFLVPVELDDPNGSFQWDLFIDFDGDFRKVVLPPSTALQSSDAGPVTVSVNIDLSSIDLNRCHRIEMLVAHGFAQNFRTFDPIGGDSIVWFYVGPGGPNGCRNWDAGAVPSDDASGDVLPIPTGGDP